MQEHSASRMLLQIAFAREIQIATGLAHHSAPLSSGVPRPVQLHKFAEPTAGRAPDEQLRFHHVDKLEHLFLISFALKIPLNTGKSFHQSVNRPTTCEMVFSRHRNNAGRREDLHDVVFAMVFRLENHNAICRLIGDPSELAQPAHVFTIVIHLGRWAFLTTTFWDRGSLAIYTMVVIRFPLSCGR